MKSGPDIAPVAAMIGAPARASMLTALADGRALTAGELAREAGVTAQTASAHLARLRDGGLISLSKEGRHAYYRLAGPDVAAVLEQLMGLAERTGRSRTRPGPKDPALRRARVCYDHLAGDAGVAMLDALLAMGALGEGLEVTPTGGAFLNSISIDADVLAAGSRPVCKACLDWSVRRHHLAGSLGAALLGAIYAKGWAVRASQGRAVVFTAQGQAAFEAAFRTTTYWQ